MNDFEQCGSRLKNRSCHYVLHYQLHISFLNNLRINQENRDYIKHRDYTHVTWHKQYRKLNHYQATC